VASFAEEKRDQISQKCLPKKSSGEINLRWSPEVTTKCFLLSNAAVVVLFCLR
jgi:hypothetical protein